MESEYAIRITLRYAKILGKKIIKFSNIRYSVIQQSLETITKIGNKQGTSYNIHKVIKYFQVKYFVQIIFKILFSGLRTLFHIRYNRM